ncbi:lysophosphatidylserine lipase ABHD12-like isoform X2 [Coccinella septempunctata]|uniref:lysophosphatidylserine lipase ABHD12-like isoform X2 n=1 Tax=Coccinella septempunctata TaxID=41139 RepID=UPI001D060962|nr:lysophosphatidylserine lipase ABHD12-like isoform X2 [Coccinella septempunctata]
MYPKFSLTFSFPLSLLVLLLLIFLILFIIIPLAFKFSTEIQRNLVFPTWYVQPKNYSNLHRYQLKGVRNLYVKVNEEKNITLGVLQILPSELLSEFIGNDDYDYENILKNSKHNVLLYFHGNGQDRLEAVGTFKVLRKFFYVISFDYRGYADSSLAELTENGVVEDSVALFKYVRNLTSSRIFFWGHSIGTGVALHTAANLKSENMIPTGVMLEAPFTSVTDVMNESPLVKAYSWLPWFSYTIIDPMVDNGFNFDSQMYILDVDCPVMIIHAKDDEIIPFQIATKLYNIARANRNDTYQGEVTYHLLDAVGYGHEWISEEPALPDYIRTFVENAVQFERDVTNKRLLTEKTI